MADTKISGLAAGAPAQATDLIPIARSGANYSITPANILAYGSSPVAGTTLNAAAGTVGAPAIYLSTDTTSGLYRIGANNDGFAISGAKVLDISSTGLGVTGTLTGTSSMLSPITNSLSGNVTLNNTSNYFTGPTVAQGSTGTWFASGSVVMIDTAGGANFDVKLWDGTTLIAETRVVTTAASQEQGGSVSGFITSPAGNIRISVRDVSSTSGQIRFNSNSDGSKTATLTAIRIG